jgi:hypothetical protein
MPRRFLSLLTVLAFATAVVLAIARPGAPLSGGASITKMAAVADALPSAIPWAYIDKIENGAGWCDPLHIDTTTTEYVGDSHQFALCVGNLTLGQPVDSFQATIGYDGTLDACVDKPCPPQAFSAQTIQDGDEGCVDGNPDASAGLGTGWNCVYFPPVGAGQGPTCDVPDHGSGRSAAGISCHGNGTNTLGDNETWGALAVINMNVIAAGVDKVDIQTLQVRTGSEVPIIACPPVVEGADVNADSEIDEPCQGATDIKREQEHHRSTPTPTLAPPTATPVPPTVPPPPPPPTATPSGGVGPQIVGPATGSGPTDSGTPWAVWLAFAGAAAAAGGLYLRRATR